MPSRNVAQSADSSTPRGETWCSLPNQRSADATLDLWLATVFAVTPTRAWCSWPTDKQIEVQRAGINSSGRSSHLAIWRSEQTQWRLVLLERSGDCSIAAIASTKLGSRSAGLSGIGIISFAMPMEGNIPRCILEHIGKTSTV